MKKLLLLLPLFLLLNTLFATPNGRIRLQWDASTETNVTYNVYAHTNLLLPYTQWAMLTNVAATYVDLDIIPGRYFFYVTATNFWGESDPSNLVSTPGVATSGGNFRVTKLP